MKNTKNYQKLLLLLFINYVFIDFIRRFFSGQQLFLLSLDINIIILYYYFFKNKKTYTPTRYFPLLHFTLLVYISLLIFQVGNMALPDLITTLAGLRSYLLPIPMILIGYYVYRYEYAFIFKLSKAIRILGLMSIAFGVVAFITDAETQSTVMRDILTPMEHSAHSFGDSEQTLTSSFFASSTRFSVFLLISYLFVWSWLNDNSKRTLYLLLFLLLFLVGNFTSGNRTMLFLFLILNLCLLPLSKIKGKSLFLFFSSMGFLIYFIFSLNSKNLQPAVQIETDFSTRIDYLFDNVDEYFKRAEMAFPFSRININADNLFFGLGLGKFGTEANLTPFVSNTSVFQVDKVFEYIDQYPVNDSGLVKTILEVGLIGFLIFYSFLFSIVLLCVKSILHSYKIKDYYRYAISFFPLFWMIIYSKGHTMISDVFVVSFLYFSIGVALSIFPLKRAVK